MQLTQLNITHAAEYNSCKLCNSDDYFHMSERTYVLSCSCLATFNITCGCYHLSLAPPPKSHVFSIVNETSNILMTSIQIKRTFCVCSTSLEAHYISMGACLYYQNTPFLHLVHGMSQKSGTIQMAISAVISQ